MPNHPAKHYSATFEIAEATGKSLDTVERRLLEMFPRDERRWWCYLTPEQVAAAVAKLGKKAVQFSLFE